MRGEGMGGGFVRDRRPVGREARNNASLISGQRVGGEGLRTGAEADEARLAPTRRLVSGSTLPFRVYVRGSAPPL